MSTMESLQKEIDQLQINKNVYEHIISLQKDVKLLNEQLSELVKIVMFLTKEICE